MELAVNYSLEACDLLKSGRIKVDRFKCPAWPDLVLSVRQDFPVYVHFPLRAGSGAGYPMHLKGNEHVDWDQVEHLLLQSDTLCVNLHLYSEAKDYPDIPIDSIASTHIEQVAEGMIRDVLPAVKRFGCKNVILENDHCHRGEYLRAGYLPEVIRKVVEETGCGFLFDLAHAQLAASYLGVNLMDYVRALPVEHPHEIHLSGIQRFAGRLIDAARNEASTRH